MKQAVAVLISTPRGYVSVSRPNDRMSWALPGGKVDPGETLLEAIVRETQEEISLTLDPTTLRHVYTGPCFGDGGGDYMTTTYQITIQDLPKLVPESGLRTGFIDRKTLTDPVVCPFSEYNRVMFQHLDAIPVV